MASAAGGSGAGGGDRCPSGEKGTTRLGRRSKKPSAFHRAFCVPTQGRLKTYVLLTEFLSFMYSTPLLSSVID